MLDAALVVYAFACVVCIIITFLHVNYLIIVRFVTVVQLNKL